MAPKPKSIFLRGAESGAFMGLFLAMMFILMALSLDWPLLGPITTVMMIAVPFLTYYFLRRSYVKDLGLTKFSELWMEGIVIFACASLIMAVAMLVWMRYVEPMFLNRCLDLAIQVWDQTGNQELVRMMEVVKENNALRDSDVAMETIWGGIFTGSILSMLVALLVQARKVKQKDEA
ncbi:MAG: DUF4199 domain-containing protein [Bacteroidales bacterium]|nr:DUF4199 domain-containing protein [Bacteroidales bacterium]